MSLACGPTRQLLKWTLDWLIEIRGYVCRHCSRSPAQQSMWAVWRVFGLRILSSSSELKPFPRSLVSFHEFPSAVKSISPLLQRKWFSLSLLILRWILDCANMYNIFITIIYLIILFMYVFICVYIKKFGVNLTWLLDCIEIFINNFSKFAVIAFLYNETYRLSIRWIVC